MNGKINDQQLSLAADLLRRLGVDNSLVDALLQKPAPFNITPAGSGAPTSTTPPPAATSAPTQAVTTRAGQPVNNKDEQLFADEVVFNQVVSQAYNIKKPNKRVEYAIRTLTQMNKPHLIDRAVSLLGEEEKEERNRLNELLPFVVLLMTMMKPPTTYEF